MAKRITFILWAVITGFIAAQAQVPVIIKDINPGTGDAIPFFESVIASYNGKLFFAADDGTNGVELWSTDGTDGGTQMVKDINPGAGDSDCQNFNVANGYLLFVADDGTNGRELWRSDGTEAGTVMVMDIRPGSGSSAPFLNNEPIYYTVWNDVLYFAADNGSTGSELWRSDGTEGGTYLVKDINSFTNSYPNDFAEYNGKLYFSATGTGGSGGTELWATDGTTNGTALVKDVNPGSSGSNPGNLVSCNGYLLFTASGSFSNQELWRSDGTDAGTILVKDIHPTLGGLQTQPNAVEKRLVNINEVVYFSADDGTNGAELWRSDGTEGGTYMVKDASTNTDFGTAPQNFAVLGDILYYKFDDGDHGQELWRSDGTEGGTYMVKDITPGFSGSFSLPTYISAIDDMIFMGAANGSTFNIELWKSDGTEVGTVLAADINGNNTSSFPQNFIQLDDNVVFAAQASEGYELWKYSLSAPVPLSISLQITNTIECFGDGDGALEVTATGGQPPYTYLWNPTSAMGPNPMNLPAGSYTVTVTDGAGAIVTASTSLMEPDELFASTSSTPQTVSLQDGTAEVMVFGGTQPYNYLWDTSPPETTASINGLGTGDYTVTITDANGCTLSETVTVDLFNHADEAFGYGFSVAPTLSTGNFAILAQQARTGLVVTLIDQLGRVVERWSNVGTGEILDINHLPEGNIYYVAILLNGKRSFAKVVLVKG
ncbi:MAG: hyalin [Lewinellaceae bacterium]|nr:hypothetical protein [Saprospiraceae bacterium]MCB9337743.1 hyalin [Lewinellaceae bacterium]